MGLTRIAAWVDACVDATGVQDVRVARGDRARGKMRKRAHRLSGKVCVVDGEGAQR